MSRLTKLIQDFSKGNENLRKTLTEHSQNKPISKRAYYPLQIGLNIILLAGLWFMVKYDFEDNRVWLGLGLSLLAGLGTLGLIMYSRKF